MGASEPRDGESVDTWLRRELLDAVADYPAVQAVVALLLDAAAAMRASGDVRWDRVGRYLSDMADVIVTPDPFMPHAQMTEDWLERNHRVLLEVARTYLDETPSPETDTETDTETGTDPEETR